MTALSYPSLRQTGSFASIVSMAWRSLLTMGSALTMTSCLLPGPPDYQQAQKTPPILFDPEPPVTSVLLATSNVPVHINVGLRSEDAGDWIVGILYLNYLIPEREERTPGFTLVAPGTFDEQRDIILDWTPPERPDPGTCEQLSLVVTHYSNLDADNRPIDAQDKAVMTWWVDINGTLETLGQCPGAGSDGS